MAGNNNFLLYGIILFSAVLLSATIFVVGGNIGGNISGMVLGTADSQNAGQAVPSVPSVPSVQQPTEQGNTVNLLTSELLEGAAGIEGNPNAEVILVEFSDYQCPFCKNWFNESKTQLQPYIDSGKVLFVYHDFPLSSIHSMALSFAEAARCAGDQGKYFEFHDKLYTAQNSGTVPTESDLKVFASDLGLNSTAFSSCYDSGKYTNVIQSSVSNGSSLGVNATPSFFLGKADGSPQLIVGAQPFSTFKTAIDSLLS